jgi:hypothetical protein
MAKIWVLDTETKGTGAQMVPLEKVLKKKRTKGSAPVVVPRRATESRPAPAPQPRQPHRFKVVDLVSREVLAEGANARVTVDLLRQVRSVVDVNIFVWEPKLDRWRLLTLGEQKALWRFRDAAPAAQSA